ncbi:MAG: YlxR family protein [Cyanobacteriota bacterium]|nr:YlxR family protein [Cyanobacteriota bacterium]
MNAPRAVLRRCVACRALRDRRDLWRVIRGANGALALDVGMGRSAYLCPDADCLAEAKRRRRLQRSLRCPVEETLLITLEKRLATHPAPVSEAN